MPGPGVAANVAVAGKGVQQKHRVVAGFVELAPRLVCDAEVGEFGADLGAKRAEHCELAVADRVTVSPCARCRGAAEQQARVGLSHRCRRHGVFGALPIHVYILPDWSAVSYSVTHDVDVTGAAYAFAMDVMAWMLDDDVDPAIRWQVLSDLADAPRDEVAQVRAQVAERGWGAALLALQGADGQWDGGTYRPGWAQEDRPFFDAWTSTTFTLQTLRDLGLHPASAQAQRAIALVRENSRWEANGAPFFEGETEPCINGMATAIGAYFGQDVSGIVDRLLNEQLEDGGWNCWAEDGDLRSSFNTTICVVEGLLEWERASSGAPQARQVRAARGRAEEYLLERALMRRLSTGELIDPRYTMFSFPPRWYYDVLRALEYFRQVSRVTGASPDPRCGEAIELLLRKRRDDGRWSLENTHQGPTLIDFGEGDTGPSRWNTLRALRVLRWWEQG